MTTEKVKTIFDDPKMKITAKPLAKGSRPPTFQCSTYLNNPQFVIYPNHDNGSGVTWISAGMDVYTFSFIMYGIVAIAKRGKPGTFIKIDNKREIPKEKRTDPSIRLQTVSTTHVQKDEEGRMFISVIDANKPNAPKIRFYFGPNYYHTYTTNNEELFGTAETSCAHAISWAETNLNLMLTLLGDNPNARIDAENAKAKWANRGGNNNNSNNYHQKQSKPANHSSSNASSADGFGGDGFDDNGGWDD